MIFAWIFTIKNFTWNKGNLIFYSLIEKFHCINRFWQSLGKAVAMRLSLEGAKVLICSRNKNSITETEQEIVQKTGNFVKSYACDVTNEDHVNSMIEEIVREFGKIDILVTNAGGPPAGSFGDFKIDDYRKAFELNLLSTINLF